MNGKIQQKQAAELAEVNRQIFEIKKKIQLSEGQRKALFEECETERKKNADEIATLKKEISELMVTLQESRSTSAKSRVKSARLEAVVGPLVDKTCSETQELLDLQVIDKAKQLNLIRYRIKQRESYLAKLGSEYQTLMSEKPRKTTVKKTDARVKTATSALQNKIHAVEVQWREAIHVCNRYKDIKQLLLEDAARFESDINRVREKLRAQQNDIEQLQKISSEAIKMRGIARSALVQEEKAALHSAAGRDRQANEGKQLLNQRKQELEKLERKIFQSGKIQPQADNEADDALQTAETPSPPTHPIEQYAEAFELLKEATGATSTQEVLNKFSSQKDTTLRLNHLRENSEVKKRALEKRQQNLEMELEELKYVEVKDAEQNTEETETIRELIEEQQEQARSHKEATEKMQQVIKSLCTSLQGLNLLINPRVTTVSDPKAILHNLETELAEIIAIVEEMPKEEKAEENEIDEDKWLPPSYGGLIRRTPMVQPGTSPPPPPPPGSDEEEEVPSRSFLKRQAQLVVDAKSRRKNLRMQVPRRK